MTLANENPWAAPAGPGGRFPVRSGGRRPLGRRWLRARREPGGRPAHLRCGKWLGARGPRLGNQLLTAAAAGPAGARPRATHPASVTPGPGLGPRGAAPSPVHVSGLPSLLSPLAPRKIQFGLRPTPARHKYKQGHPFFLINLFTKSETVVRGCTRAGPGRSVHGAGTQGTSRWEGTF